MAKKPASEDEVLKCLARHFPNRHSSLLLGRGDDCAVLKTDDHICVSSDLFLEDIHFRRNYFLPEEIGYKALAVNISDIAGCGARPLAFSLNLVLPSWVDMDFLDRFFAGMAELAEENRIALLGGDLSSGPSLCACISVYGTCFAEGAFLARGGSMPGDQLFVVGCPGLARVGLEELEKRGRDALEDWPDACSAHLRPVPRTGAGLMLARAGLNARLPALMDVSDGIMRDLPRLLGLTGENGSQGAALGASIWVKPGNLHPEVVRHAEMFGRDVAREALQGGEDYILLGSCAPDMLPALKAAIPGLWAIGRVLPDSGIFCNGESLETCGGFDHFEH